MSIIKIEIRGDHCRNGQRKHCAYCPYALAIEEAIPNSHPVVSPSTVILTLHGRRTKLALPVMSSDIIVAYDEGQQMRPHTLELQTDPKAKKRRPQVTHLRPPGHYRSPGSEPNGLTHFVPQDGNKTNALTGSVCRGTLYCDTKNDPAGLLGGSRGI